MAFPILNAKGKPFMTCERCIAVCCKYIAVPLDEPEEERDVDDMQWFLLHENIGIYVTEEGDWYIEFHTPCKKLEGNKCGIYTTRPEVCKEHPMENCEMNGEGEPWEHYFKTPEELLVYIEKHYKKKQKKAIERISEE